MFIRVVFKNVQLAKQKIRQTKYFVKKTKRDQTQNASINDQIQNQTFIESINEQISKSIFHSSSEVSDVQQTETKIIQQTIVVSFELTSEALNFLKTAKKNKFYFIFRSNRRNCLQTTSTTRFIRFLFEHFHTI